jgi:hypothetical protein
MPNKIENESEYKIIIIIVYFLINTIGFSFLFLFSPRTILLNDNKEENKILIILFKNFAKDIYDNINTPLIKNLTLIDFEDNCTINFEPLAVKNQYYGNFTKFFENKKICIERFTGEEYSFQYLLKTSNLDVFNKNKKKCGKLIQNSNIYIYVPEDIECPLNNIEINGESRAKLLSQNYYPIGQQDECIVPLYGKDENRAIINIEIVNNYKICVEKYIDTKGLSCEFPDNNECLIDNNYEEIFRITHNESLKFYPDNLAKWNLINDSNIEHNFCKKDLIFHMFSVGYISISKKNLEDFEEEFPPDDVKNNSLYKLYEAYKSPKNIDNVFDLIAIILLFWSLTHFIIQIMIYLVSIKLKKIYIINGIILLIFKLISLFGIMTHYFCFYLKIEKVYLILEDNSRNEIIKNYSYIRRLFIIKIILICLVGFLVLCIDFIIFIFSYSINLEFNEESKDKKIDNESNKTFINKPKEGESSINEEKREPKPFYKANPFNNNKTKLISESSKRTNSLKNNSDVINNNLNEITLKFLYKSNINKSYIIKIEKNQTFNNAVQILKEKYSELKDKDLKIFQNGSSIINRNKTIDENGLSDNKLIYIL